MIYADSGIIIRWVEGAEKVRAPIEMRLQRTAPADRVFVTSRLSLLECRCKPLRDRDEELLRLYDDFFDSEEVRVREIDVAVVERATAIRAAMNLKVPDAIHAATAILDNVTEFWTTDRRFSNCPDLNLEVMLFPAV